MVTRSINSPGVEIFETDISQYATNTVGTSFLVMGYADKGEELNPLNISNTDDYITNFGEPTNDAERYSYYAAKKILTMGGNLIYSKLPYNNILANNYKYIGLTVGSANTTTSASDADVKSISSYFSKTAEITATTTMTIATSAYDAIKAGGDFSGDQSSYNFIIVNENKSRITGANNDEGIFVVLVDPIDAMKVQRMFPTISDSDTFKILEGISYPAGITSTSFESALTGTFIGNSVSENIAKQYPTLEYTSNGSAINPYYAQQIGLVVCQATEDSYNQGKIQIGILEAFVGSIHTNTFNPTTGNSIYIGDVVNGASKYITIYGHQSNSTLLPSSTDTAVVLYKADGSYPLLGFTSSETTKVIEGGSIASNMSIVFSKVNNIDDQQIDVVVDAGLSTIAQYTNTGYGLTGAIYDPVNTNYTFNSSPETWRSVCNSFIDFCAETRGDCMTILDTPRTLALQGNEKVIRKTNPSATFSNSVYNKVKYLTGLNSSYAALYTNWMKIVDDFTGISVWIPESIAAAGAYVYTDRNANIWDAPAGLNRGVINGIVDISFNPNIKESDLVYLQSMNYAKKYPTEGYVIEGQKTTQVKASAFDRVNVRRLFLRLERIAYKAARYFVYQPNNAFTRQQLLDVLTPSFAAVKAAGGLYDYKLVCDETNNTDQVIDNNELHVAVLLKPVKTAEFILINFVATKTSADFTEIIQQVI